jgi:hypothetical protein
VPFRQWLRPKLPELVNPQRKAFSKIGISQIRKFRPIVFVLIAAQAYDWLEDRN